MLEDAFLVCSESCLISSATTAKPFPASPALAASIEAFNARRLVWLEISTIEPINPCTSSTFSVRLLIQAMKQKNPIRQIAVPANLPIV